MEVQSDTEISTLKEFHMRMRGSLDSFRAKDWNDYTTASDGVSTEAATDVILGSGDGSETQFQLVKRYATGESGEYVRTITLPIEDTVEVRVAGVAKTRGTDYTVSDPGGVITFTTAPTMGQQVTAGCQFDVPARFEKGMDAWAGIRADASGLWSMPQLDLVEVLDEVEHPERWDPGGSKDLGTLAADYTLSFGNDALLVLTPNFSSTGKLILPVPPTLHQGGPGLFVIVVKSGTGSVRLYDDAGNAVGAAWSSGTRVVDLLVGSSSSEWFVR